MIIPTVSAANLKNDAAGLTDLIDQLKRWSLFGTVALTDVDSLQLDQLETLAQQIGGAVDLEIELLAPDESTVLTLLNAGAATIICPMEQADKLHSIPCERLTHLYSPGEQTLTGGQQIKLLKPTAARLADLETIGVRCLVDADLLDSNPELIADYLSKSLISDRPDGLWSTLIVDPLGQALGLAYSNYESLLDAITHRRGTYWSRSRGELWIKGATSGAIQQLIGIRMDCDRDCLRFQVTQDPPGFCHLGTHACFGTERTIESVTQRLCERLKSSDEKSFTKALVNDPAMLRAKLLEEAQELSAAESTDDIIWESADVLFFSLVKMLNKGVKLEQVYQELARRMNRVVRRKNKLD